VDHYCGDVVKADITRFPGADLFWASPSCPWWTDAAGRRRDFDRSTQGVLFGPDGPGPDGVRSRALMEEIPRYLAHWTGRGRPVLAGVVENVVQCRLWDQWNRWTGEIHALGYHTRVIALNSMHAASRRTLRAPQSRDRLYVAYWLRSLGRGPDWDKWLRPHAWCPACDQQVTALQVFKVPGRDMGRYRTQYVYRCPNGTCRHQTVEPEVLPAAVAIDWTLPGQRIGDRKQPLAEATMGRIRAGLTRYAVPLTVPAGGTWRSDPQPVTEPLPARTTRANDAVVVPPFLTPLRSGRPRTISLDQPLATIVADGANHGLAVPPLLVPVEGRAAPDRVHPTDGPMRAQTCRNETGLAWLPFLTPLRGGGDRGKARSVAGPLHTFSAKGTHHGLAFPAGLPELAAMVMRNNTARGGPAQMCTPAGEPLRTLTMTGHQSLLTWAHLLMPYYGTGRSRPVDQPIGTLTSRDRYALASAPPADLDIGVDVDVDVDDVLFRMLQPHEIGRGMAFADGYIVLGDKRAQVRQYGNAVTPPVAEVIVAALVEAITGEDPYEAGDGG
jgi:DNA (cytosine-5)-methyltransferase 1